MSGSPGNRATAEFRTSAVPAAGFGLESFRTCFSWRKESVEGEALTDVLRPEAKLFHDPGLDALEDLAVALGLGQRRNLLLLLRVLLLVLLLLLLLLREGGGAELGAQRRDDRPRLLHTTAATTSV